MGQLLRKHGQMLVNGVVTVALGAAAASRFCNAWRTDEFDLVEALFFTHVLILLTVILVRRQHVAMEKGIVPQAVALVAFFSSLAFDKTPDAPHEWASLAAEIVSLTGIALGIVVLLNLGRSFGIMIAVRRVKTTGAYAIVRHPMYVCDTILRTSFILVNPSVYNVVLYVAATGCYVWRAFLEERFLSQLPEYREYMERVRYRFIPFVL